MSEVRCRDLDVVHALPASRSRAARSALSLLRWTVLVAVIVVLAVQGHSLYVDGLLPSAGTR